MIHCALQNSFSLISVVSDFYIDCSCADNDDPNSSGQEVLFEIWTPVRWEENGRAIITDLERRQGNCHRERSKVH